MDILSLIISGRIRSDVHPASVTLAVACLLLSLLSCPCVGLLAQSSTVNYVLTHTMLDSLGTQEKTAVQYYDGLGRPIQLAENGLDETGRYMFKRKEYDLMGHVSVEHLPVPRSVTSPIYQSAVSLNLSAQTYYDDAHTYSLKQYDPLGRITAESTPGDEWYSAGKGKTTHYRTNTGGEVKRYQATTSWFSQSGYWSAGSLTGERTTDEDGITLLIFRDMTGNVVLERRDGGSDTHFVYDDKGRLCFVLTPLYQSDPSPYNVYQYKYDAHGRIAEKTLPGGWPIKYWYDRAGRMTFMQDQRMRHKGQYRFFLYDALGRRAVQGLCYGGNGLNSQETVTAALSPYSQTANSGYRIYGSSAGTYLSNPILEEAFYYDSYQFLDSLYFHGTPQARATLRRENPRNANGLTVGCLRRASDGSRLYSALYYDSKGQTIDSRTMMLGGETSRTATEYSFTGQPTAVTSTLQKGSTPLNQAVEQFTYGTLSDKVTTRTLRYDGTLMATLTYLYNPLGNLSLWRKGIESVSMHYDYDLHGWQKSITAQCGLLNVRYSESLSYAQGSNPCYNGNISRLEWNVSGENYVNRYDFRYDGMNRLTQGLYSKRTTNGTLADTVQYYTESMAYNENSALTRVVRRGIATNGWAEQIDNLTYQYYSGQLSSITDTGSSPLAEGSTDFRDNVAGNYGVEYAYDSIGSLIYDTNRGISHIRYDANAHPLRIQFCDGNIIENVYTPNGTKLRTVHRTAVPGLSVLPGQTLELGAATTLSTDTLHYMGPFLRRGSTWRYMTDVGYVSVDTVIPRMHYYVRDHLGSVAAVLSGAGTVEQANHYYPTGVLMAKSTNPGQQRYKYNGKEFEPLHGLNWNDYGARWYDPATYLFTTVDPLCEKYYHISPYSYCGGNPINRLDPDGQDYTIISENIHGKKRDYRKITISAIYYANKNDLPILNDAIKFWNAKHYSLKDKLHTRVVFNLTSELYDAVSYDNPKKNAENIKGANSFNIGEGPFESFNGDDGESYNTTGATDFGNHIRINPEHFEKGRTIEHEIGHTLGLVHENDGLMTPITSRENSISKGQIRRIIKNAFKGTPDYEEDLWGNRIYMGKGTVEYK